MTAVEVHFRFDNSDFDPDYMGNEDALKHFSHVIDSIGIDKIDSVVIVSHSSPEGQYEYNLILSHKRAASMRNVIEENYPDILPILHVHPGGESWDLLRSYVSQDQKLKQSTIDNLIGIIDSDVSVDTKKWQIEQSPVYRYIRQTYYPLIRSSIFCVIYYDMVEPLPRIESAMTTKPEALTTVSMPVQQNYKTPTQQPSFDEDCRLLIKTNLLDDIRLSPSLELEYRVAPHWSVLANSTVAWLSNKDKHQYYQLVMFGAEGRYWLDATKPWKGQYAGIFVGAGFYDLENRKTGYKGEYFMSGISYGYMFPIGKRLSLDAGVGVGFLSTPNEEYLPIDGHYVYQQSNQTKYFGPVKLKLALTYHIPHRKYKKEVTYE